MKNRRLGEFVMWRWLKELLAEFGLESAEFEKPVNLSNELVQQGFKTDTETGSGNIVSS